MPISACPESIEYGPFSARVVLSELEDEHGEFAWTGPDPRIRLNHWGGVAQVSVLVHEALHMADELAGLGLGEEGVSRAEFAFMELLRRNPKLREAVYRATGPDLTPTPDSL